MVNPFYDPGERRAAKVDELFATIARRYDLINDVQSLGMHRLWKRRLIRMANIRHGERALDVCCGTGDLARALARRGAIAAGLDFNLPMLEVAKRKQSAPVSAHATSSSAGCDVHLIRGDAQRLPFADNSFEIVTIGYGLRNLESWESGLREMCRVAKAGGRLLVLDFGKPDNAFWRAIYFGYLKSFVPLLGRIFCGNAAAYAYILESLQHYPAQRGLAAGMRDLGLVNVQIVQLLGGIMSINYAEKPNGPVR